MVVQATSVIIPIPLRPVRFPGVVKLKFTNYVWNIGNTTDRFNLTLTNSTFPTGSQIEFYRADGVTPY